MAREAIDRIVELYAIEAKLRDLDDATRLRERRRHLAPRLDAFKHWLDGLQPKALGNSGLSRAVHYTLRRREALMRVLDDGAWPIGRVEMWRGGVRFGISVAASFDRRCLTVRTMTPFPHPAHRTVRADFPHTALFQCIRPSRSTSSCVAT
ncbi:MULTISPECIES: IS66 family transposase [Rhodanobacter]|uniref:IS66 family transposase n=1 Tax=Rhodanobacter TaxID=75309 RepID=UPI002101C2A9|nr:MULTISPECIES: transposase [Rhodanobacter]